MAFVIPQAQLKCDGSEALDPDAAAGVLQELEQHDALYVSEGDNLQEVQALVRSFPALDTLQRARLWEVLSANVTSLSSSISTLLEDWEAAQPDAVLQHKSALNMYLYLLHGMAAAAQTEAEAQRAEQQRQQSKTGAAKPRGKAAATGGRARPGGSAGAAYSWPAAQCELLRALAGVMALDLPTLFKGLTALERGVLLVMDLAMQAACDPTAAKGAEVRSTAVELLCLVGIKYGQVEEVAAALFRLACGQEHGPELVAAVVKAAETSHNNSQMAVALVCQFSLVSPSEYQPSSSSAKHAGQLLAALAEVAPRAVNSQLSQLQPYLACKAATIRAGLVSAVGSVLEQLYHTEAVSAAAPAGALSAHARSKEHLLSLLSSRLLDKDSYVRQRTLHTWARLVATPVVPLPLWNVLLNLAIGRLEDGSSKVVKAALQLLFSMIQHSPFGRRLAPAAFAATLAHQEALLEEMAPAAAEEGEVWGGGTVQVKKEPEEAREGGQLPASPAPPTPQQTDPAFDGKLQRLRATVASLREAAAFAGRLEAAMPQLAQLLCYPATDVVQNTIALLTFAERFQVPGAGGALRSMWPLVFSKEEAVRGAVLDSWHRLTLAEASPAAQVELLLSQLLPRSTLAELTALEAIFKALAAKDAAAGGGGGVLLDVPALLHQVLAQTCRCYSQLKEGGGAEAGAGAEEEGGSGEGGLRGRLRSCFTLVALLAAADPAHVASQWEVLLEAGFSAGVQDAWVMTQCATAFTHMAPHLPGSPAALLLPATTPAAVARLSAAAAAAATSVGGVTTPGGVVGSEEGSCCPKILSKMLKVLLAPPESSWTGNWNAVAQGVVGVVYGLHPSPQVLMGEVLQRLAAVAASTSGEGKSVSAGALGRFFFLLGATVLQQLLLVERLGKAIAKRRSSSAPAPAGGDGGVAGGDGAEEEEAGGGGRAAAAAKKAAAAAQAAAEEDIAAQLGVGGSDLQMDLLVQQVELQILSTSGLLGRYGRLLSGYCASRALLAAPEEVAGAALLALTHCMAADMRFCADNVALVFTLLVHRLVPPAVRCNLMTALADLASRWPNVLEPWTPHMYSPLTDADPAVKRCALTALTHLVLGGVVKAKGHVAKVALLLEDEDPDIKARALLFFDSLSRSGTGNARSSASAAAGASASNPVYNLLPDMLSGLVREPGLGEEQFRGIMAVLLQKDYVKEKQADALRDKLAVRMEAPGAGRREWRCLAWCIRQLGYSEKGARGLMDLTRHYKHALGEPLVFEVFKEIADKAKRSGGAASKAAAGGGGDLREQAEEWEAELVAGRAAALEQAAVEEAAERRRAAQEAAAAAAAGGGGGDVAGEQEEAVAVAAGGAGDMEEGEEEMEVDGEGAATGVGAVGSTQRRSSGRVSHGGQLGGAVAALGAGDSSSRPGMEEGAPAGGASRKRRSSGAGTSMVQQQQQPTATAGLVEVKMEQEEEEEQIVVMTSQLPEGEVAGEEEDAAADLTAGLDGLALGRRSRGGRRGRGPEGPGKPAAKRSSARSSQGAAGKTGGSKAQDHRRQQQQSDEDASSADEDEDDVSDGSSSSEEAEEEQEVEQAPGRGRRSAAAPAAAAAGAKSAGGAKRSSAGRSTAAAVTGGAAGRRRKQVWIADSEEEDSD